MIIPVRNVAAIGLVPDMPFEQLPLNAWTSGKNVRFKEGAVEKFTGHSEVYATPTWAPYWLMPVGIGSSYFWLYAGQTKAGATDGAAHADITRAAGDYATDLSIGWTGTVVEGIAFLTNGVDTPQMWNTPALATKLANLTNWPPNTVCRALRNLKSYIVAFDITKTVTRYPTMIKWSDRCPTGGVPISWDETDETKDAGEWTLPSDGGYLVDAFPLRDDLAVYKEGETWKMQFAGGIDVFRFIRAFSSFGMFSRRSAIEFFNGKHLVFAGDDVVLHDLQQAQSLMNDRAKSMLRGILDPSAVTKSFVALDYIAKEVWICVPETGFSLPNKALVWNWLYNTWGVRDLPNAAFIASGIVNPISPSELWSGAVGPWSTDSVSWGDRTYSPNERKMLMAVPGETKLHLLDTTNQFNAVNMTSYVEKRDIGWPLKADSPPDFTTRKLLRGLWPRISGTQGGVLNIFFGVRDQADDNNPISWAPPVQYTIGSSKYVDALGLNIEGRLHSVRFESTGDINWRLHDYDADVVPTGQY